MKRFLAVLLAFLLCLSTAGCTVMGRSRSAAKLINADVEGVSTLARTVLAQKQVPADAFVPGVEAIEYCEPGWVGFVTGSREEENSSAYCGFYFSEEDLPMAYQGRPGMELSEDGSGWKWQESEEHYYYTERIQYNWFYYEVYQ